MLKIIKLIPLKNVMYLNKNNKYGITEHRHVSAMSTYCSRKCFSNFFALQPPLKSIYLCATPCPPIDVTYTKSYCISILFIYILDSNIHILTIPRNLMVKQQHSKVSTLYAFILQHIFPQFL